MNIDRKTRTVQFFDQEGMYQSLPMDSIDWAFMKDDETLILTDKEGRRYEAYSLKESSQTFLERLSHLNPEVYIGAPCSRRYDLSSLNNTRDLGGLETRQGTWIRPGLLIRSGAPQSGNRQEWNAFADRMHIHTLLDLRSPVEILSHHPVSLKGREYVSIPLDLDFPLDTAVRSALNNGKNGGRIEQAVEKWYRDLAHSAAAQKGMKRIFALFAKEDTAPVVFYCSQGKDRTGVVSYLLELILGVDEATARENYMLTNEYLMEDWQALKKNLSIQEGSRLEGLEPIFLADERYLDAFQEEIWDAYGSFEGYFQSVLDLDSEKIKALQARYTI